MQPLHVETRLERATVDEVVVDQALDIDRSSHIAVLGPGPGRSGCPVTSWVGRISDGAYGGVVEQLIACAKTLRKRATMTVFCRVPDHGLCAITARGRTHVTRARPSERNRSIYRMAGWRPSVLSTYADRHADRRILNKHTIYRSVLLAITITFRYFTS